MTVIPAGRQRFDRGAWGVLLIAVAWGLLTALGSALALNYPSDGFTITRNSLSGAAELNIRFHTGPTPLRPGDLVLAIGGEALAPNATAPVGPGTRAGEVLVYTVERDGQRLEVPVTLAAPGPAGWGPALLSRLAQPRDFVVTALIFAVVLATFLARPGILGARYLLLTFSYYFAVQWFGYTVSDLYRPTLPPWLVVWNGLEAGGWFWFFFPSIALTALSFPVVKWPLRRFPRLLPGLLYGLPLLTGLVITGSEAFSLNAVQGEAALIVFIPILLIAVMALAGSLGHNWLTLRDAVTRAQLRWVTFGMTLGLLVPFAWLLGSVALTGQFPGNDLIFWLPVCVPVSLAIAITRYRLFDIDVIIRRTLVYTVLSGLLALVYFGSVLVLQNALNGLTGGASQAAIVLSTLLIAALFGPLRGRVQQAIDRRFYRRKYDAARTLAAFGASVRDEVDLDALGKRLTGVVDEAMQPTAVGLWVRAPGEAARLTPRAEVREAQ